MEGGDGGGGCKGGDAAGCHVESVVLGVWVGLYRGLFKQLRARKIKVLTVSFIVAYVAISPLDSKSNPRVSRSVFK